jgi:hypothetical protein
MPDDDAPAPIEFDSFDEAVAHAMSELEPGGTLTIHEEDCQLVDDADGECDCTPWDLPIGARA